MALAAPRLSAAIFKKLTDDSRNGFSAELTPAQKDMIRAWCDAIAAAVVEEITTNATVAVAVTSVSGVTPGSSPSGPGTGTGKVS